MAENKDSTKNHQKARLPIIKNQYAFENTRKHKEQKKNQKSVCDQIKKTTAQETWINIYAFLENLDWDTINLLPYKITSEPFLQSLQYKILNRILNCNYLNGKK